MTTTSTPTETITLLRSDKPLAKEAVLGNDGIPVVGRVKIGFLFDVTEWPVAGFTISKTGYSSFSMAWL